MASWACGRPVPRSDGGGIAYTVTGIAHRMVSHTKWYLLQYTMNAIVIIVDSIGHYCAQSKVAQCVDMTLHSDKIEQAQQCGSTDRPNLVWRTQWHTTGTHWYRRKHSQRGICHVLLHTLSQVLQLSVYSKSVWPGPNTAPATSCQRRSKCLVSQTFCKSLLLCRSKCQRTPTGVT